MQGSDHQAGADRDCSRPRRRGGATAAKTVALFLLLAASLHAEEAARLHRSLYEAAAAGDLQRFEAALQRAGALVDSMPLGDARNRLRRAVVVATDLQRVIQFDGMYWDEDSLPDFYDRLANEYAGFEAFITPFRVIDRRRRVFYPSRETRIFLLKRLRPNTRKTTG
jgi:hypothetical protein